MPLLSAEQFAEEKFDLPEGGRWSELIAGEIQTADPPDDLHGNVILNLSKAIAAALRGIHEIHAGFEVGLIVGRSPDTVLCPPISFFQGGELFAEADKVVTDTRPVLVVEIPSTPDRRRVLSGRIERYLAWGIPTVWVFDTCDKEVQCIRRGATPLRLTADQKLFGGSLMPNLEVRVGDMFAEPKWYRG